MAKEKFGKNARTKEIVTNFYRYVNTYNPKAAEVVSANLGGPDRRWMKKLNAQEIEDTILVSGNCNEKVVAIMEADIERQRNPNGTRPTISLAIDATKVSSVLEVSHEHKAIFGGEFPSHIIDIAGKTKEDVRDILDGKSDEYGKVNLATEIKICSICFVIIISCCHSHC